MLNYKQFLELIKKENPISYIVAFKGTVDPKTKENWCSDCVKAEPNIKNLIQPFCQENKILFYSVEVGLRDEWKDQNHLLRKDKFFRLTGVPTIIFVQNNKPLFRLVEEEIFNEKIVKEFLKEIL